MAEDEDGAKKLFQVPYMLSSIASEPKAVASECSVFGIQGFRSGGRGGKGLVSFSPGVG